jgi:iron complex transport system ATP-binding protein
MIAIHRLSCGYGSKPVLEGVTLDIPAGEVLCILGRNGIGKTTLFRTLLGAIPPLSGAVLIGGRDLFSLSRRERAERIAYVPQSHTPPFAYSAMDVVLMGRSGRNTAFSPPSALDRALASEALERLGVAALAKRDYTKISGGERQLILIARALCQGSDFLLLDEPAAGLDIANQIRVLRILRNLAAEGKGVVFTSHDPNHALLLDTQVAAIKPDGGLLTGKAAATLTAETVFALYGIRTCSAEIFDEKGSRNVKTIVPYLDE